MPDKSNREIELEPNGTVSLSYPATSCHGNFPPAMC